MFDRASVRFDMESKAAPTTNNLQQQQGGNSAADDVVYRETLNDIAKIQEQQVSLSAAL